MTPPSPVPMLEVTVMELIQELQTLQLELETRQPTLQAAPRMTNIDRLDRTSTEDYLPILWLKGDLILALHRTGSESTALDAVTAVMPPCPGRRAVCSQSYSVVGNVGLHVCGVNVFICTMSRRGQQAGLFHRILITVSEHQLDVITASVSTSGEYFCHSLYCQANQGAQIRKEDLHSALQSVISNFYSA